jgi:hypothetical protein
MNREQRRGRGKIEGRDRMGADIFSRVWRSNGQRRVGRRSRVVRTEHAIKQEDQVYVCGEEDGVVGNYDLLLTSSDDLSSSLSLSNGFPRSYLGVKSLSMWMVVSSCAERERE